MNAVLYVMAGFGVMAGESLRGRLDGKDGKPRFDMSVLCLAFWPVFLMGEVILACVAISDRYDADEGEEEGGGE